MEETGYLQGLTHQPQQPVAYFLQLDDKALPLNPYLGKEISLTFTNQIACIACGRKIKKTYNNGYCYPCFRDLAENDLCIVKPHECHYHLGTCRDNTFGETHCMIPHYVYLALSSDVKVGLTRKHNQLKRWTDQGAVKAVPIAELPTRKEAGELEVFLSQHLPDKTNWRKMLKSDVEDVDLASVREEVLALIPDRFRPFILTEEEIVELTYPILETLDKIKTLSFDKTAEITGLLVGIKGQYLILREGVINVKKYAGYQVKVAF